MYDFQAHLTRQCTFSRATFGPDERREGVINHILEELDEVRDASTQADVCAEWTDVAILGLDGLMRASRQLLIETRKQAGIDGEPPTSQVAELALSLIVQKQELNELRTWPDWRTMGTDEAIGHDSE